MRVSQDKLPPAIDLGRAVPDSQICKPRANGELRVPTDKVRREVVAALQACSSPGGKGRETPFAQVVTALGPWWSRNQDSTLPEVLADLVAPRGKGALSASPGMKQQTYVVDVRGSLCAADSHGVSNQLVDRGKVLVTDEPVVCMTDTQANASHEEEVCGTLTSHAMKDAPVVAYGDGRQNE